MKRVALAAGAALFLLVPAALAEETETAEKSGWTGEGALSAGLSRGNTNTSDIGLKFDVARDTGLWDFGLLLEGDYGKQDGVESRNRAFAALDIGRDINERLFAFGRASYEVDQFTGFDSRTFAGGGLGYHVAMDGPLTWTVKGGPGVKVDEVKRVVTVDDQNMLLIIPAMRETSFGAVGTSELKWALNDAVTLSNDSGVVYAKESTQLSTGVALTAALNGSLKARVSFDTRYDTNPPLGFDSTDTASKIALVYTLGE
ncbi:MAG: DUF481 domain-containing protein [Hyphomonas sp.]|nr:DUF481 domain-containing protein [Hyphomonas sp.]